MQHLPSLFREFCKHNIADKATPLKEQRKQELVNELKSSPLRRVIQAWTVLDFYDYKHLWTEGFDTYFGYPNESVTADSILEIVHPEDAEAVGQLYYLVLEGLLHMPVPVKNIGHFCISYRMKNSKGDYVKILETNNIIESDELTNIPLVCLTQINKIEGLHKSNRVQYYFLIKDENQSVEIMQGYLSQYNAQVNIFNQNEIRIASLLKAGNTSQEIADKIFLSKHTIDKYRKGLLEKTQTANTPELLSYLTELSVI